jgi:hypothetical protein
VVKPDEALTHVVKIFSSPPTAKVMVDGQSYGKTPKKLELRAGTYTVSLTSGDRTVDFAVVVTAGGSNKWCYDFETGINRPGGC